MKRYYNFNPSHNHLQHHDTFSTGAATTASSGNSSSLYSVTTPAATDVIDKSKMWESEQDTGDDELLAVLGYKVRSLDMTQVAQKLEHLEEVMGQAQQDGLNHLGSDTVHYNPSDLSSWLESMISELNPSQPIIDDSIFQSATLTTAVTATSSRIFQDDYDLKVIPGNAVYPPNKKLKPSPSSTSSSTMAPIGVYGVPVESTLPIVLVESEDNEIQPVHTLMACVEAVQQENLKLAEALVKQIGFLAVSQAGAMRKVATYSVVI